MSIHLIFFIFQCAIHTNNAISCKEARGSWPPTSSVGGPRYLVLASDLIEPLRLVTTLAGPKNMLARLPRRVSPPTDRIRHQCNVPFIPHNMQLLKRDKKLV
jgi:hypothetical protein